MLFLLQISHLYAIYLNLRLRIRVDPYYNVFKNNLQFMFLSLFFESPIAFFIVFGCLILAITVHEFAHAWVANRLGDPTPRLQGRLNLNPLSHLDPLGTLMIIIFGFGWGRPVQFDPFNLENPRRDAAIISFAGPFSNMIIVTLLSLFYRFLPLEAFNSIHIFSAITILIRLNLALAIFNLIPIHPLDGGKILVGLLPSKEASAVDSFLHKYGMLLLIALIFPVLGGGSAISVFISPIINFLMTIYLPANKFI